MARKKVEKEREREKDSPDLGPKNACLMSYMRFWEEGDDLE